jgi:hypothetical protein
VGIKEFAPQDGEGRVPGRHLRGGRGDSWAAPPRSSMAHADIGRLSCIKLNRPAQKLRRSILASISAAEDFSQALAAE